MLGRAAALRAQQSCSVRGRRRVLHARVHAQCDCGAVPPARSAAGTTTSPTVTANFGPVVAACADVPSYNRDCHRRSGVFFILLAQLERYAGDFGGCICALRSHSVPWSLGPTSTSMWSGNTRARTRTVRTPLVGRVCRDAGGRSHRDCRRVVHAGREACGGRVWWWGAEIWTAWHHHV